MDYTTLRFPSRFERTRWLALLTVGLLIFGWLLSTPAGLLGKADAVGYAVCHRIDLRSFHLGDRPLPLCARCTGMYLGALLGLVYQAVFARRRGGLPPWRVSLVLGIIVLAFALDGFNSLLQLMPGVPTLYRTQNWSRLVTGTGIGVVIAAVLFPAFNQTLWRVWDQRPAFGDVRALVGLLLSALTMDAVILIENPLVLYPLALASASGVLVILTLTYVMIFVLGMRWDNRFDTYRELMLPLLVGSGLAFIQIFLIDLGRLWITGTWEGFHLG